MKIHSIHMKRVGPHSDRALSFADDWMGGIADQILLSGPNGCGKSTVLRSVANLWELAAAWLTTPSGKTTRFAKPRKWLEQWSFTAVIIKDFPQVETLGLFFGEAHEFDTLRTMYPQVHWLGEIRGEKHNGNTVFRENVHHSDMLTMSLSASYKSGILTGEDALPNIIHLDGEERRWVASDKKKIEELTPDDPQLRWLASYKPTVGWKGQLENSLFNLKAIDPDTYYRMIQEFNRFLKPKRINAEPHPVSQRLKVEVPPFEHSGDHYLDELSSGEKQVLIQLFIVSRWLQPGGVVMIDEPDLHLHPSLLSVFLSTLESLVKQRDGQLILTSHNPELWRRYENKGLRIKMGGEL